MPARSSRGWIDLRPTRHIPIRHPARSARQAHKRGNVGVGDDAPDEHQRVATALGPQPRDDLGNQAIELRRRQPQRLADVADSAANAVRRDAGDERRVVAIALYSDIGASDSIAGFGCDYFK